MTCFKPNSASCKICAEINCTPPVTSCEIASKYEDIAKVYIPVEKIYREAMEAMQGKYVVCSTDSTHSEV